MASFFTVWGWLTVLLSQMTRNPPPGAGKTCHYLREPEVKVLDAGVEVLLLVGFFQFLALFGRLLHQELPLVS